jgi:16S rRNA (cytosine967-C5)-methyltransferase
MTARKEERPKQDGPSKQDGTGARRAAANILQAVLNKGETLETALNRELGAKDLANHPSDRAFARAIATTVLRRLGQIDAVLDAMLDKTLPESAAFAHALLRVGTAELLFLASAPHAAVNCAVELTNSNRHTRPFRGLMNAILRRVTREGADIIKAQEAGMTNTPYWAWRSWELAYGPETAGAIADAHLGEPPLDLSVKSDPEHWARKLGGEVLPTGSVRLSHPGRIEELEGYGAGDWWVQDAAAALPHKLLGDVSGEAVLDLCAAPGGKTLALAAAGAKVTAVDRAGGRLERLRENLTRTKLSADIVKADLIDWAPGRKWKKVLLDAPCSATGTARRHPDVLHSKTGGDIASLAPVQAKLLSKAAEWLEPGGTLIYCTCSLEPLEGPAQVGLFLKNNPTFARRPIDPQEIGGLTECITPDGDLRTLPSHLGDKGGMDGFYAARLVLSE